MSIIENLAKKFGQKIKTDNAILEYFSRDASLFEVKPQAVFFPENAADLSGLVNFVSVSKKEEPDLSITARSGGSDMSGGPLGESVVVDFTGGFEKILDIGDLGNGEGYAIVQPGVFYKDFEKKTLEKGYLLPTFPASRELCTVGGMVANNAAGEKTLKYGKTEEYVLGLKMICADGREYEMKPLNLEELEMKMKQGDFEGDIYRRLFRLIEDNYEVIEKARPDVSKNSAGYYLWNVYDKEKGIFDITRIVTGSQGTLGLITEIKLRLIRPEEKSGMLVVFLKNLNDVPETVKEVLSFHPSSLESYDDNTLWLALRSFWGFVKLLKTNIISLAFGFLPDVLSVIFRGMPKLVLLIEFEGGDQKEIREKLETLHQKLKSKGLYARCAMTGKESKKYWVIRRESFNLLRKKIKNKQTAPFVDDVIVKPEYLSEFLPKLYSIMDKYGFFYTIAGHVGDGNFHIIPLMDLRDSGSREKIFQASDEVYDLVLRYKGSITAEHNDGIIRTPYLEKMYGKDVYELFRQVKQIFDPLGIFNPGKKYGGDIEFAKKHLKRGD